MNFRSLSVYVIGATLGTLVLTLALSFWDSHLPEIFRLGTMEYQGHHYIVLETADHVLYKTDGPFVHDPDSPCHLSPENP